MPKKFGFSSKSLVRLAAALLLISLIGCSAGGSSGRVPIVGSWTGEIVHSSLGRGSLDLRITEQTEVCWGGGTYFDCFYADRGRGSYEAQFMDQSFSGSAEVSWAEDRTSFFLNLSGFCTVSRFNTSLYTTGTSDLRSFIETSWTDVACFDDELTSGNISLSK